MKLQESKGKYSAFFPTSLIKALDWKKGDDLKVKFLGKDRLELRKR